MSKLLTGLSLVGSLMVGSHAYAGDQVAACMTASDLAWSPSIARAVPLIDTEHKGCVTGDQIAHYRAALKQARAEEKERIVSLLATR